MNKIGKVISITAVLVIFTFVFVLPASALLGKDGFYYYSENDNLIVKEYRSSNAKVEVPSNVYTYKVVGIAEYAFLRNTDITSVIISDTVTRIGDSAFYGCSNLEKAVIPASVTTFGDGVFSNCEKLTIECYTGSAAETYAKENSIPYTLIDNNTSPDTDTDTDGKVYKYGDADLDGDINSADSLKILRRSVKLESFTDIQDKLADVDGDGSISSSDALDVLRYSVKLPVQSRVGEELKAQ